MHYDRVQTLERLSAVSKSSTKAVVTADADFFQAKA
jgi:hypothetical protein